ncbi:2'-5' RNA ligase family protein [Nocardia aurea]|uniref:2'-5' RNA ligase family protein n=1 Tax=Nocardia aurea TaxID=2144174 RepID=UPI0033A709D9
MSATKRPFPLLYPTSTTDADPIIDNDWSAFRQLSTLHDHWTMKSWAPGQSGFYWYITFRDPALVELARHCQEELAHDGLDPVPVDGLHLTLLSVGKVDDVSPWQVSDISTAARASLAAMKPFDLTIGPLTGSRSALRFSVTPWTPLLDIHHRLREATALHRPSSRLAETIEFRPHLGIGYINRTQPAGPLVSDVAELRDLPPVTVRVEQVRLVELRRDGHAYRWDDRAVIDL